MYRIVIADDEQAIRDGLATYVAWKDLGFELAAVLPDGLQVIRALESSRIDVALCDIRMPGATGLDVARYVYEHHLPTTVALLSAHRDFEYARSAMSYGVRHYVVKSARYQELLDAFMRIKQELDEAQGSAGDASEDPVVQAAKEYIRAHLDTASLEEVAAHLDRSAAHLSRLFKERAGEGFSEYLTACRMEYAAKLLQDVRATTYSVAERVGYASPKNFTRSFVRYFGMNPREYRARQQDAAREDRP